MLDNLPDGNGDTISNYDLMCIAVRHEDGAICTL